jgi:hypothetical protein
MTIGPVTGTAFKVEVTTPNGDPTTSAGANATNERTYDSSASPVVTVPCAASSVPEPDKLRWTIQNVGSIQATWNPSVPGDPHTGKGLSPTATFSGMPPNYNDFGPKTITLTVDGFSGCQDTQVVEVFFPRDATNHPGGQTGSPNFYHYWSQTTANFGTHVYAAGSGTGFTSFEGGQWVAHISDAQGHTAGGTWGNAEGIDLFANLTRHEEQHRLDLNAIWAGGPVVAADDLDAEWLKDAMEPTLFPGRPYIPTDPDTYPDKFNYLPPPPYRPLLDVEDYALGREAAWTNGSANDQDWVDPGMQHRTKGDADD